MVATGIEVITQLSPCTPDLLRAQVLQLLQLLVHQAAINPYQGGAVC